MGAMGTCSNLVRVPLALLAAASAPIALAGSPNPSSYFGLNGTKMFHIPEEIEGLVARRFGWMKELGVTWDRIDLWWHVVEPKRGQWDFSRSDACFAAYERNGVQWYPILCYGSAWFEQGRNTPRSEQDFADFAQYVSRTVSRYRGRAPYWSMWNEPNILPFWAPQPDVEAYTKLMKLAYPALKKADPKAKLCAPVIAPLGSWDRSFVERMYQAGGKDYFDVFDYHYYRHHAPESEVPAEIAEIQAVKRRYGDAEKPIWISEAGVTSLVNGQPGPESRQAAFVVRNHLLCLALGVQRFFYFDLQNWYDDRPETWDTQLGLVTAAGKKKKSFDAYRTMVRQCDGKRFVGRIERLQPGIQGVLLHDPANDELTLAAWSTQPTRSVPVPIALSRQTGALTGPYGDRSALSGKRTSDGWTVDVPIGENPVYLHGIQPAKYLIEAGSKLVPAHQILAPGERATLKLGTDKLLGKAEARAVSVQTPKNVEWNPRTGSLRVDPQAAPGKVAVRAKFEVAAVVGGRSVRQVVERTALVEITPSVNVTFRPYLEKDKLRSHVRLSNQSSKTVRGDIRLTDGKQNARVADQTLAPMATTERSLPIPAPFLSFDAPVAEWRLEWGPYQARRFRVYGARFSDREPRIDGDLSDWHGVPSIEISGAEQITRNPSGWSRTNASARCQAWFSPHALCFAASATDNDPMVNVEAAPMIWKGDSLEVYLGVEGPTKRSVIDKAVEYQLGFAPTYEGGRPLAFWFHKDVLIDSASVAAKKSPTGYVLEGRVPWSAIGVDPARIRAGALLGFDVKLNDLDRGDLAPAGNLPGRDLVWNGTGANWIDPSGWGIAVLKRSR